MPDYIQDPNNSKKQVPGKLPKNAYDRLASPANCDTNKTPNSVLITTQCVDNLGFWFGSSASFAEYAAAGKILKTNYTTLATSCSAGTTFKMSPTVVSSSAADIGKVQLVYNSALSTGGR